MSKKGNEDDGERWKTKKEEQVGDVGWMCYEHTYS